MYLKNVPINMYIQICILRNIPIHMGMVLSTCPIAATAPQQDHLTYHMIIIDDIIILSQSHHHIILL